MEGMTNPEVFSDINNPNMMSADTTAIRIDPKKKRDC
jgi:hypothetical protein